MLAMLSKWDGSVSVLLLTPWLMLPCSDCKGEQNWSATLVALILAKLPSSEPFQLLSAMVEGNFLLGVNIAMNYNITASSYVKKLVA